MVVHPKKFFETREGGIVKLTFLDYNGDFGGLLCVGNYFWVGGKGLLGQKGQ